MKPHVTFCFHIGYIMTSHLTLTLGKSLLHVSIWFSVQTQEEWHDITYTKLWGLSSYLTHHLQLKENDWLKLYSNETNVLINPWFAKASSLMELVS